MKIVSFIFYGFTKIVSFILWYHGSRELYFMVSQYHKNRELYFMVSQYHKNCELYFYGITRIVSFIFMVSQKSWALFLMTSRETQIKKIEKKLKGPVQKSNLRLYDKKKILSSVLPIKLTEHF